MYPRHQLLVYRPDYHGWFGGGLPLIFGVCIAASPVEMIVSRTFKYLRSVITPLVSGIVVLLIGLSLIKVEWSLAAVGIRLWITVRSVVCVISG